MQTFLLALLVLLAAGAAAILVAALLYVQRLDSKMTLLLQHVGVDAAKLGRKPNIHVGQGF